MTSDAYQYTTFLNRLIDLVLGKVYNDFMSKRKGAFYDFATRLVKKYRLQCGYCTRARSNEFEWI